MKRDMDLCRKILFTIEESDELVIYCLEIEGYSLTQTSYHCKLLYEAGLVSDYDSRSYDDEISEFGVGQLTWEGHDYLEKIRDDTRWNKIKAYITEKALPFTIDIVKDILPAIISIL